jgi:hypothetical protein
MSVYGTHEEFSESIEKHKVDAMDFPTILAMLSLLPLA